MRKLAILTLFALLAACKPAADKPVAGEDTVDAPPMPEAKADGPAAATTAISLDGEGLRFVDKNNGKTSLLAFGVPRAQAEEALARVAGKADDRSTNEECGAGPMEFTRFDAMTLNFQDGKFVGWFLGNENGASEYSTMSGIGIGTTRAKAKESVSIIDVEDSTLGEEFSIGSGDAVVGGMFAEPGEAAKIDALFAGANCFFR
ncbi:hypothetical protein L7H23_13270 [Sphingopyxis sp. BSN-002]|uniref:hypothetical protein n=1 Tax=Sphingopyxis sp. BSN-002 TaxID=2911495 RepID=UPI001EDBB533|nr:hypothetical protein [Sphingopyxis sp. BSN-002]UKK83528.1 hypothetical protein L7H23_13270 [Sphingopyxis sp. BSN-002]